MAKVVVDPLSLPERAVPEIEPGPEPAERQDAENCRAHPDAEGQGANHDQSESRRLVKLPECEAEIGPQCHSRRVCMRDAMVHFAECLWNSGLSSPAPAGGVRLWDSRRARTDRFSIKNSNLNPQNVPFLTCHP